MIQVLLLPRVVKVADAVSILRSNKHNGFPVVDHTRDGEPLVIGLMLRSHLLVLLQSKIDFQHSPLPSHSRSGSGAIRHNFSEFAKPVSSKGISIDDIYLSSEDLEMYIDLAPFLNPSPYVVPEDMSLTKVYNLFRQLGLRHIFVVPRASRVIGVITRKDLLIEEESEDSATMELQSTSVRGQRHKTRLLEENGADAERPLLNGLLVQNQRYLKGSFVIVFRDNGRNYSWYFVKFFNVVLVLSIYPIWYLYFCFSHFGTSSKTCFDMWTCNEVTLGDVDHTILNWQVTY
ncbi:Chloride channel CLC-d -like protein [Gossypium arboreum]|uniref:Chloride channel CLC-d-like protein n=1 Tax=Gossypium arboreum TaxID=29729 RepID=A0A0B0NLS6_GOSAR|nr:Chloride channel CLC-d -like protein [Gossypium arboreum]